MSELLFGKFYDIADKRLRGGMNYHTPSALRWFNFQRKTNPSGPNYEYNVYRKTRGKDNPATRPEIVSYDDVLTGIVTIQNDGTMLYDDITTDEDISHEFVSFQTLYEFLYALYSKR